MHAQVDQRAAAGERRWVPDRAELRAAAWFLGLWAPWFAWRWWYYGWPFPNTYYVKAAGAAVPGYDANDYANEWLRRPKRPSSA